MYHFSLSTAILANLIPLTKRARDLVKFEILTILAPFSSFDDEHLKGGKEKIRVLYKEKNHNKQFSMQKNQLEFIT